MACGSSAATSGWSFAFSMNVRAVTMSPISAPRHAAIADVAPGGEVEHRGHAPLGLQREEGDEGCARRRKQHADAFAFACPLRQHTAERIAGRDETSVTQGTHLEIVGHEVAAAVLVARVDQRVEQRGIDARGREHRLHHLVAEGAA